MRSATTVLASVLWLAALPGCYGPQLQYPRGSQLELKTELEAQRAASFKRAIEIYERLTRVSTALRVRAAPLCGQEVLPVIGLIVLDQRMIAQENRDIARRMFNLTNEDALVISVIADTPAAKGGLEPGDLITRVDGGRISLSAGEISSIENSASSSDPASVRSFNRAKNASVVIARTTPSHF